MNVQAVSTTSYVGILENGDNVFVKNYPWICLQHRKTRNNSNAFKPKIAKELHNLQKIKHQNVLPIKDYRIHDGYFSIVSSLIPNGNIIDYIKKNEVDLVQRVNLIKDVATGLHFLHQRNIVHGDLRGDHVLINEEKQIKLTEYGIAQVQANVNKNFLSKANSSVIINYNCWTAPELFIRNEIPTFESDVYSFGMLCYEILYGNQPFEYRDIRELKENVCIYKLRPQRSKLNISCPDWLWKLMTDCWRTEAKERISLEEVIKILNNPPPMEEHIENTIITIANMRRSQSFINKSKKVNSLISRLSKHGLFRSSSRINDAIKESSKSRRLSGSKINVTEEVKPLSETESNLTMEKNSISDSSISTMSSGELDTYIQSIQKNAVTALLTDSDLATLKCKSYDEEEDIKKEELEKINKKRNRRSLSSRLSFRNSTSSIYNVNVYSGSTSDLGRSFYISNDANNSRKKSHRSSTMRKWSISPEVFLSLSRKSFRKDSSNVHPSPTKHEKKIISEEPIVEEPSQRHTPSEEKIVVNEELKKEVKDINNKVEELAIDEQEGSTIANSQEELTEKDKSIESLPLANNVEKNEIIIPVEKRYTDVYPSPKNSVNAI